MTHNYRFAEPTNLTGDQLVQLRERAGNEAGRFVDPTRLHRIKQWWHPDLGEWAADVIGGSDPVVQKLDKLSWYELVLLDLAHDAEPTPPPPPKLTAQREQARTEDPEKRRQEQARFERQRNAWVELKAAMPVPVSVAFNYSRHTYEFYAAGRDHIVTWEDLHIGRLYRPAGTALCATRNKKQHIDNAELERQAQEDGTEVRLPSCGGCLKTADRVTGLAVKDRILTGTTS